MFNYNPIWRSRQTKSYNARMTNALADILASRFDQQPDEITLVKEYILKKFDQVVAVALHDKSIIISTRSSAFAGALRPELYNIAKHCKTKKRLVIRVGL